MNFQIKTNKTRKSRLYGALITTAFLTNGLFPFITPVLAQTAPTAANTPINNQATATYEDPNNPADPNNPNDPKRITTTSNTVTVTIAEVAGILVQAGTVNDVNGGTVQVGDALEYNFTVTNIGNDPTRFKIPEAVTITGNGTLVANSLEYQQPGTTTWLPVPSGGVTTNSVPVNGVVPVRVRVTVNSGAASGDNISVTLGQTTPANTASNSPRNDAASSNDNLDVYTVDNINGSPNEVDGTPANLVVEGSATATKTVDPKSYSLATLLKTRGVYNNNNTAGDITDDTVSYNLSLRVEPTDVTGKGIVPAPLAGSTVPGLTGSYILVSDAIPTGTQLAAAPTAPSGWTVVYSTTAVTTTANAATWTTSQPGDLTTVTRIGFVKLTTDGDTSTYLPLTTGAVQPTQFAIQLKVKTGQTAPLTIANIAQVFGKTPTTNAPVIDESGDQNPSNFDGNTGNMTPPPTTDTNGDNVPDQLPTTVDDGFINNPGTPETGVDTNGDNTGAGTGGEANTFTINTASVLNGPNGVPNAVGPTNNNDDFTNKSTAVPAGTTPGSTFDPGVVTFTNTVRNDSTQASNISLVPTPPAPTGDLPNGTEVTITYNAQSITYVWNGTVFQYKDPGTNALSAIDQVTKYITIPNIAAGTDVSYTVAVNLPGTTPLSTDINRGFPVPVTAFVDDATPGLGTETVRNTTIDRVYTGFLKLVKFSAIEQGTGPAVGTGQENFASTPAAPGGVDPDPNTPDVDRKPAPGNIIVYQIRYKNISEPSVGTGNVILNAANVVITEDGTASPSNWAKDNDGNNVIDTSHVSGSSVDSGSSTITFFSGNPANTLLSGEQTGTTVSTDVTKYIDTVTGQVAPGVQRTFTFKRKVN